MWQRIIALIWKELLIVWRDKRSRFVLIVPPLIQLFIFSFAATLDVKNVPIGILNLDNGEKGIELVQRFIGSPIFFKNCFSKGSGRDPTIYRHNPRADGGDARPAIFEKFGCR